MNLFGYGALISLEFKRIWFMMITLLLLLIGIRALGELPICMNLAGQFMLVFPFLTGLLFSIGVVADDSGHNALIPLLALPISHRSLLAVRSGFRLVCLFLLLASWWLTTPVKTIPARPDSFQTSIKLSLLAVMVFGLGIIFSQLLKNTFEAAMATLGGALTAMALLHVSVWTEPVMYLMYGISAIYFFIAAFHILERKELIAVGDLRQYAFVWLLIWIFAAFTLKWID